MAQTEKPNHTQYNFLDSLENVGTGNTGSRLSMSVNTD